MFPVALLPRLEQLLVFLLLLESGLIVHSVSAHRGLSQLGNNERRSIPVDGLSSRHAWVFDPPVPAIRIRQHPEIVVCLPANHHAIHDRTGRGRGKTSARIVTLCPLTGAAPVCVEVERNFGFYRSRLASKQRRLPRLQPRRGSVRVVRSSSSSIAQE